MSTAKHTPFTPETLVRTTQENVSNVEWTIETLASRQWNVQGVVVVAHHDSHGVSYNVRHPDGTLGRYNSSELEVV